MIKPTVWHAVLESIDIRDADSGPCIVWQGYSLDLVLLTAKLKEEMQKVSNFWELMGPSAWEREAGNENYSAFIVELVLL